MDKDKPGYLDIEAGECHQDASPLKDYDDASSVICRAAIRTRVEQRAKAQKEKSWWKRAKMWLTRNR